MAVIHSLDYEQALTGNPTNMSCIQYFLTKSLLNYYAEISIHISKYLYVKLITLNYLHIQPAYIKAEHSPICYIQTYKQGG